MDLKFSLFLVVAIVLIASVWSHPTYYPDAPLRVIGEAPIIFSWHVHILYNLSDDDVASALELRNKTISHFKEYLGEECLARFDEGRLCMIRDHELDKVLAVGPFVAGECVNDG